MAKARKFAPNVALRNFRAAARLTQAKLAELAGYSQTTIARLETGETQTTAGAAAKLAPHLGRQPRDLFPSGDRDQQPDSDGIDAELMTRAYAIGRRLGAGGDDELIAHIAGLTYALLKGERDGRPITDDERTLATIEGFVRRIRRRGPL